MGCLHAVPGAAGAAAPQLMCFYFLAPSAGDTEQQVYSAGLDKSVLMLEVTLVSMQNLVTVLVVR